MSQRNFGRSSAAFSARPEADAPELAQSGRREPQTDTYVDTAEGSRKLPIVR